MQEWISEIQNVKVESSRRRITGLPAYKFYQGHTAITQNLMKVYYLTHTFWSSFDYFSS